MTPEPGILHASAVAFGGRGLLILGASGSGKSTLALRLMNLGARLVSDDRVIVSPTPDGPALGAPDRLRGLIEARGLGILRAPPAAGTVIAALAVDMDAPPPGRMPPRRTLSLAGSVLPLKAADETPTFAAGLAQALKCGFHDT